MSDAAATEAKPAAGGKKNMMIIGAVVVALAGGGGYWFMARPAAAGKDKDKAAAHEKVKEKDSASHDEEEEEDEEPETKGEKGLLEMEPFVVNLADEGGSHFLRANVQFIIAATEAEAKELEKAKVETMPLRSAVLEILAQQKANDLVTPEGKEKLKAAIKKKALKVFKKHKVKEVLFAEFVVQF